MSIFRPALFLLGIVLLLAPDAVARRLDARFLFAGSGMRELVSDTEYLPASDILPAADRFEGVLSIGGRADLLRVIHNPFGEQASALADLPDLEIPLAQEGGLLVPLQQGLLYTGHARWNVIVGPGRVWREPGDGPYSRAALPLSLVARNQNCVHQGSLTFLFRNNPTPSISRIAFQITGEGCPTLKFDMAGLLKAGYRQQALADADAAVAAHRRELAGRGPRSPLSQLALDHPGTDPDRLLASFRHRNSLKALGIVVDGRHYSLGCRTRSTGKGLGEYPFCDDRRLPSYSTAKSVFASLAQMRLGQMYGPGLYDMPLPDLLPEAKAAGGWDGVTLAHLNDMATGRYGDARFQADEEGQVTIDFLLAEGRSDKLAHALNGFPVRDAPGRRWVYHSTDTYLATAALDAALKARTGGDLFERMVADLYGPLGLSQGFVQTIRSGNGPDGMASGYYGLFYNLDDIAKLGRFLADGTGMIDGVQVLDPVRLRAALYRDGGGGLPVRAGWVYRHNSWGRLVTPETFPDIGCHGIVPVLSGYGGITIMLPPNGLIYYAISDGYEYPVDEAIRQLHRIRPLCPSGR